MTLPAPQNGEEAGYLAFAIVDELISLLLSKDLLSGEDIGAMLKAVMGRLENESNSSSQRASRFLAERMGYNK